jgi:hypothetical protein
VAEPVLQGRAGLTYQPAPHQLSDFPDRQVLYHVARYGHARKRPVGVPRRTDAETLRSLGPRQLEVLQLVDEHGFLHLSKSARICVLPIAPRPREPHVSRFPYIGCQTSPTDKSRTMWQDIAARAGVSRMPAAISLVENQDAVRRGTRLRAGWARQTPRRLRTSPTLGGNRHTGSG